MAGILAAPVAIVDNIQSWIAQGNRLLHHAIDPFDIGTGLAFALDCCDRETLGHVATTQGIKSEDIQDMAIVAVEYRFGLINRLPHTIEWPSDNGSCYIAADTKKADERYRYGTQNNAGQITAIKRHGRGLCQNIQARLCRGQPNTGRANRHQFPTKMVRAL